MSPRTGREDPADSTSGERLIRLLPFALLAVGMFAALFLLLDLTSRLTFIADEWNLILLRQGWGVNQILEPFNGHPIMAPAVIFKLLQEIFGIDSARPMQIAATVMFLVVNGLLFLYLRSRVSDWMALIGTFLILFLGAAFEDLLFSFQIGYFGSLAAGIGALIALDRDDSRGDAAAAILLVVSLLFSSIGIPFVAAVVIEWILNPRDRIRRWFVPGAAILFYAVWWIGWGHETSPGSLDPQFELSVLPKVPGFVFEAFAAGLTSIAGLATGDGSEPDQPHLIWGKLLAVLAIGLTVWRLRYLGRIPRHFLVTAGGGLSLLLIFALAQDAYLAYGAGEVRPPTASRYQLPIAVFIMLAAANLLVGVKPKPVLLAVAGGVSLLAIWGGISLMTSKAVERWEPAAIHTRAALAGVEAADPDLLPSYTFRPGTSFDVPAGTYLEAVDHFGSPAFTIAEVRKLDSPFRVTADASLAGALGVELNGAPPPVRPATCRTISVGVPVVLPPGSYVVENLGETELGVNLARLSDPPGILIGSILPLAAAGLDLPAGGIDRPWNLGFSGEVPGRLCRAQPTAE